mmetsp:Transcript_90642/g.234013  ORF Transcript_90642/g.234013 Transcript_90642/m.234013 type:complete len:311 (+) Transcript_90642:310-1242(+)
MSMKAPPCREKPVTLPRTFWPTITLKTSLVGSFIVSCRLSPRTCLTHTSTDSPSTEFSMSAETSSEFTSPSRIAPTSTKKPPKSQMPVILPSSLRPALSIFSGSLGLDSASWKSFSSRTSRIHTVSSSSAATLVTPASDMARLVSRPSRSAPTSTKAPPNSVTILTLPFSFIPGRSLFTGILGLYILSVKSPSLRTSRTQTVTSCPGITRSVTLSTQPSAMSLTWSRPRLSAPTSTKAPPNSARWVTVPFSFSPSRSVSDDLRGLMDVSHTPPSRRTFVTQTRTACSGSMCSGSASLAASVPGRCKPTLT